MNLFSVITNNKKTFILLCLVIIIFIRITSYPLLLLRAGVLFNPGSLTTLTSSTAHRTIGWRVIMYRGEDAEDVKFIYAQRTLMGFWWRHLWTADLRHPDTGIITTTWHYSDGMNPVSHIFAHGNNAIDTIYFTHDQLPPYTTVKVWQEGTEFTLQLTELRPRFPATPGIFSTDPPHNLTIVHSIVSPDLLVYELLVDNGFIEPSRPQYP